MKITRCGAVPSRKGPADYFTGTVRQDPVVEVPEPGRLRVNLVTFEPGARTAWHTHPFGQTLYVMSGCGLAQTEGEPAIVIRPGDTIFIPAGERHWHGAGPATAMAHLAMQEADADGAVRWLEHVSDADYAAAAHQTGAVTA